MSARSLTGSALRATGAPLQEVALHANDVVRFLQPGAQLVVQIGGRCDADVVSAPARAVVDCSDNSTVREPAMEGETSEEVVLARRETGEANTRDGDKAGLLREHLDVAERFEQRHVVARGGEDPRRGSGEEGLQRVPAARVPQVTADEACAAFRAVP